jgi:hypothetical protein
MNMTHHSMRRLSEGLVPGRLSRSPQSREDKTARIATKSGTGWRLPSKTECNLHWLDSCTNCLSSRRENLTWREKSILFIRLVGSVKFSFLLFF